MLDQGQSAVQAVGRPFEGAEQHELALLSEEDLDAPAVVCTNALPHNGNHCIHATAQACPPKVERIIKACDGATTSGRLSTRHLSWLLTNTTAVTCSLTLRDDIDHGYLPVVYEYNLSSSSPPTFGCTCSPRVIAAPRCAAETLSERVTSVCGRMSVVSLISDLKQLLRSVMYSVPGYGSCRSSQDPGERGDFQCSNDRHVLVGCWQHICHSGHIYSHVWCGHPVSGRTHDSISNGCSDSPSASGCRRQQK